mmetsp:Transcript_754/g.1589  ORF Transcript_754/g.1589 Transcript_754/m.1589 type:complete len:326 (+) Transcript_754:661-1638(+)
MVALLVLLGDGVVQLDAESHVLVRGDAEFRSVAGVGSLVRCLAIGQGRAGANRVRVSDAHVSLLAPEIKGTHLVGPEGCLHADFHLLNHFRGLFFVVFGVVEDFLVVQDAFVLQSVAGGFVAFRGNVDAFSPADDLEGTDRPGETGTATLVGFAIDEGRRSEHGPFSLEFLSFLEDFLVVRFELELVVSHPPFLAHRLYLGFRVEEFVSGSLVHRVFRIGIVHEFELGVVGILVGIFFLLFVVGGLCRQQAGGSMGNNWLRNDRYWRGGDSVMLPMHRSDERIGCRHRGDQHTCRQDAGIRETKNHHSVKSSQSNYQCNETTTCT